MRRVAIAGVGLTGVSEHWAIGLKELFAEAALRALDDAGAEGVDSLYVANMCGAPLQGQLHLGAMMANALGARGIHAVRVEAGAASGGVAFHEGVKAVASGLSDCTLVGGVEKMSDGLPEQVAAALMMSEDQEYSAYTGVTRAGLNALLHRHYMEKYGINAEDIAMFAVRSHEHAVGSPHAQYPFKVSVDRIIASPMDADPVHMLECAGVGDGAAAVVLIPFEDSGSNVEVVATSVATDSFYLANRRDLLTFDAVSEAAARAYKKAGVAAEDIDVLEVHDDTTITGVLSIEDLGFVEKGKGAAFVAGGGTTRKGEIPTNTFGGLKARGHPLGATGLYQIGEIVIQLRGDAGPCQVDGASVGMAENLGGLGSTCSVTILRRV